MSEPTKIATPGSATEPSLKLDKAQIDLIALLSLEGPVMIGEYRGEGTELIKFTNKKTGSKEEFTKHSMAIEFGTSTVSQMSCDIDYPKNVQPTATGYVKGQRLVLVISGLTKTRDQYSATCAKHRAL
jgi:hypothetical protein